jgi:pyridoxal phosphate-dependent aminotransferase EpsN
VKTTLHQAAILLSPPHMSGAEQRFIEEAFASNWIAPLGPHVDAFERELAEAVGAGHAAAVSSGTAAIHLALRLLGVGPGDRVFCSSLTFVASANPILYQGAEPVFIDAEPDTWGMSPQALERALDEAAKEGRLPKAVIVVHLFGQCARMDEIAALCDAYGVPIVEDAAEALGSSYRGRHAGTIGRFGIYSFNGNKIITTSGGGMLVSDDGDAIREARVLASQARDPAVHYEHSRAGYNYRLSNVLAGIGLAQLAVLQERVEARRAVFDRYRAALADRPGIRLMPELPGTRSNRWLTALTVDERLAGATAAELVAWLAEDRIESRPVWKPLHLQPLFAGVRYYPHGDREDVSARLFRTGLCLPSGSAMTPEEQERVIERLKAGMKSGAAAAGT